MKKEIKEIISSLSDCYALYKERNNLENEKELSLEDYVDSKLSKPIKPKKKSAINNLPCKKEERILLIYRILVDVLVVGLLALIIFVALTSKVAMADTIFIIVAMAIPFIAVEYYLFNKLKIERSNLFRMYQTNLYIEEDNKNIENYNNSIYPKKLSKYQEECKDYDEKKDSLIKEYNDNLSKIDKDIDKLNTEINGYKDLISPKYMSDIPSIISILEDGRADSLKDALNLMISDKRAEELFNEQKRKNDILEDDLQQQRLEQARANREMASIARQQADEQARANRESERLAKESMRQQERENRRMQKEAHEASLKSEKASLGYICSTCKHVGKCGHTGKPYAYGGCHS